MNSLVHLEENLPNLACVDDPAVALMIRAARGVVMPRGVSERRYLKIASLARDWFPNLDLKFACAGKTSQTLLFYRMGVRHPETYIYAKPEDLASAERQGLPLDFPFVLKGDRGGGGNSVFPVTCSSGLLTALSRLPAEEPLLLQRWVEHGGMDLRVVVVGKRMVSYFRRGDGFYNNVCRGGRIERSIFPGRQLSARAAVARFCRATGINLAGFDLMFSDEGPPLFIEMNYNFGRKGMGGTTGFRRVFREAVALWQQGLRYP
jgi:ribosomal protein S6--L-glutamate ligase